MDRKICIGLFTLLDTDSDPHPGVDICPQLGIRIQIRIQVKVHSMGSVSVQYNVAIGFGVGITVGIRVRVQQTLKKSYCDHCTGCKC